MRAPLLCVPSYCLPSWLAPSTDPWSVWDTLKQSQLSQGDDPTADTQSAHNHACGQEIKLCLRPSVCVRCRFVSDKFCDREGWTLWGVWPLGRCLGLFVGLCNGIQAVGVLLHWWQMRRVMNLNCQRTEEMNNWLLKDCYFIICLC